MVENNKVQIKVRRKRMFLTFDVLGWDQLSYCLLKVLGIYIGIGTLYQVHDELFLIDPSYWSNPQYYRLS